MNLYKKYALPQHDPKTIFITGGSSGIGRASALLFAAMGHNVAVTARSLDRLGDLQTEADANGLPGQILPLEADVTEPDAMQRAAALTLAEFNRLDVLVANAGLGHRGALVESEWEHIETVLRTNIDGVIHSIRATVPGMRASGGGHIILISSISGPTPAPFAGIYGASKAAVDALGRSLRGELKADRIHVSVLWVGQTHTKFADNRLGRPGKVASKWPTMTPEQVAGGVARALERKPRATTLRWQDRAVVWAGRLAPALMDRLLARVYGEEG